MSENIIISKFSERTYVSDDGLLFVPYKYYSEIQKQAIERGFAEYNKTTGEWQWKESEK